MEPYLQVRLHFVCEGEISIMKKNRTRNVLLTIYVTEDEKAIIQQKMQQVGIKTLSQYARKMMIDGYIIQPNFTALKELEKILGYLSRNINQIALRANETRNIYRSDVEDLKNDYAMVKQKILNFIRDVID